ncbi:MAG TPA: hypothetical protein VFL83_18110 [Anaeromyxobacter sp.]|nr:hypothetical protein [Anaeromyxobacter sp.]
MLAPSLSLLVWLAAGAGPDGEARPRPRDENVARAERGLLPRKVRRTPPAGTRRIVVVPPAATWLGEPDPLPEPASLPAAAGPERPARPAAIAGAVSGVEVDVTIVLGWEAEAR